MGESLKSELRDRLEVEMEKSEKSKELFTAMGSAIIIGMVAPVVDAMASS